MGTETSSIDLPFMPWHGFTEYTPGALCFVACLGVQNLLDHRVLLWRGGCSYLRPSSLKVPSVSCLGVEWGQQKTLFLSRWQR